MKLIKKINHFSTIIRKWLTKANFNCPSCGSKESIVIDRKNLILTLRRCYQCQLLFKVPTTSLEENILHYNREEDLDFASQLPSMLELSKLINSQFKETAGDCSSKIQILKLLGCQSGENLLDFGGAWGYHSWQLKQAGYKVQSFEISAKTCYYARNALEIDAYGSWEELTTPIDIFFSIHALEHIPNLKETIDKAWHILKPGGLFIAFTANGCRSFRAKNKVNWYKSWENGHINFLDEVYYNNIFQAFPRIMLSTMDNVYSAEQLKTWNQIEPSCEITDLSGSELFIAARKPK
ncbi:MAG: methyltransferase domain-containing protein [Thiomargarita sp.]|nr:methyltransferase domain-containing protein [Thiomargarita sp.]